MSEAFAYSRIPVADYLRAERTADVRHEYVDGEVFAMVGASRRHNHIGGNLYIALRAAADPRGCAVYASDVKVRVEAANAFYYPDLVVTCAAGDDDPYVVHAPSIIVEILSDSTEAIDRREKRMNYQRLPSLTDLLLVAQDERRIDHYRRGPGGWDHVVHTGGAIPLESLGAALSLETVYAGSGIVPSVTP